MSQMQETAEKSRETAEAVEKIEKAILTHMEAIRGLIKQSDDFTHRENVKVYRNVQAVVVEEGAKQAEALAAKSEELAKRSDELKQQVKGLRPLMIVTLLAALANIGLFAAQLAGVF